MADNERYPPPPRPTSDAPAHTLFVRELPEPARGGVSFAPTHPYVETCWLPVLGPSATWALRRLSAELARYPDGFTLELAALGPELGLGNAVGRNAPIVRTLERLARFDLAEFPDPGTFAMHRRLPTLNFHQTQRLGPAALALHRQVVDEARNPLLYAALGYARRGWPVLPLRPGEKVPDGHLAPHGLNDATTNEDRVRAWWASSPHANVGIRTGMGLDVIDLDSAEGRAALLASAPEPLTPSAVASTGRGWHLYYASSGLASRVGVLDGVDVRGVGGYVVAPPSRHPDGHQYHLIDPATGRIRHELPDGPLAPAPAWLVELCRPEPPEPPGGGDTLLRLRASHYARVALEAECAAVATTPDGSRNDRLNRAAYSLGTLVGAGALEADETVAALLVAARIAGLGEHEAARTIASGLNAGACQPRRIETDPRSEVRGGITSIDPNSPGGARRRRAARDEATEAVVARSDGSGARRAPPASDRPRDAGPRGIER